MTVCTKVTVPAESFALHETLSTRPALRVEFEQVVPVDESLPASLWISSDDTRSLSDRVIDYVAADETVRHVETLGQSRAGLLLQVAWNTGTDSALDQLAGSAATVLSGRGTIDGWELVLRFPARETLASYYQGCCNRGLDVRIESIYDACRIDPAANESGLTQPQRETLRTALDVGYFAVPRDATLQDLAAELGISDTATSQRLRRGLQKIVSDAIA